MGSPMNKYRDLLLLRFQLEPEGAGGRRKDAANVSDLKLGHALIALVADP